MGNCLGGKNKGQKHANDSRNAAEAEKLKVSGNELFAKGEFREASVLYQKAIRVYPINSIFYSNSAICYYKLKEFGPAYSNAKIAWDIDKGNIKALVFCIKSSASLALKGNIEQFNTALAHCQEITRVLNDQDNPTVKEHVNKLKSKVESILSHVNLTERKNNLLKYYKSLYNKSQEITKIENFFESEPVIINSLFCPITLVLYN